MQKLKAAEEKAEREASQATTKEEKKKKLAEARVSQSHLLGFFVLARWISNALVVHRNSPQRRKKRKGKKEGQKGLREYSSLKKHKKRKSLRPRLLLRAL